MENLIKKLDLKRNSNYTEILERLDHNPIFSAPEIFINLITDFNPFNMDLCSGIVYTHNKIGVFWFIHELGLNGNPDDVSKKIDNFLTDFKFIKNNSFGDDNNDFIENHYYKDDKDYKHHLYIQDLIRYSDTESPKCGGTLSYEIDYKKEIPPPSIENILSVYPEIICPEIPENILKLLNKRIVSNICYGGTRKRYYTWEASIICSDGMSFESEINEIKTELEKNDFMLIRKDLNTYIYKNTKLPSPIIYLSTLGNHQLNFRIQPHT